MTIEETRRKLGEALRDARRRQLAHIAVLDIAMATTEALEAKGVPQADVARATEEISAFLTGDIGELSADLVADHQIVVDALTDAIKSASEKSFFAPLFGEDVH